MMLPSAMNANNGTEKHVPANYSSSTMVLNPYSHNRIIRRYLPFLFLRAKLSLKNTINNDTYITFLFIAIH
jgi:hypothetical protein